jgi:DEAD/DEAH box helicase domain-containing protein
MSVLKKKENPNWSQYSDWITEYKETKDLENFLERIQQFLAIDDNIPFDLLSECAQLLIKIKQIALAKKFYARILEIDRNHRQTWKELSSLYFKLKDIQKGEICLKKYFTLGGGNPQLKKATKLRLKSSGKLKSLPQIQELGLQDGLCIKKTAPSTVLDLNLFAKIYNTPIEQIPTPIKKIISHNQHQIVDYRLFPEQLGEDGISIDQSSLDPEIKQFLIEKGISNLFKFQEEAFEIISQGKDICIVAPTGNGKTEAFLLPTLESIKNFKGYGVQLLLIYPMKALAKDQLRKITDLAEKVGLSVTVFDGDTSHYQRNKIYLNPPEILITNPDILNYHLGIGKNASRFQELLASVKTVILDEIHSYSGTFGSNMFFILKRLERVIQKKIQFIGSSATVANASSFASMLFDRKVRVVECKNGKRGPLHFLILSPYPSITTTDSLVSLINSIRSYGKMLIFQDSHRRVEYLYQKLGGKDRKVAIHRAGLAKSMREKVEQDFRDGMLNVLLATPTLELGIDIGDINVVITPPITVNRAMQRIGRAGRSGQEAIAIILLNSDDPISQFYLENPATYYTDIEDVYFDPSNPFIAEHQLLCTALDRDISIIPLEFPTFSTVLNNLVKENYLTVKDEIWLTPTEAGRKKAQKYSIRGKNHEVYIRLKGGKAIGRRAMPLAMFELYSGAFYYAGGVRYKVTNFYFSGSRGSAELIKPKNVWGSTYPLSSMKPEIISILKRQLVLGIEVGYIEVKILWSVYGYTLETPSGTSVQKLNDPLYYSSRSKGILFKVPQILFQDQYSIASSIHTLVHVLLHASLPFIGGQLTEIGGLALLPLGHILLFDQESGSGVCAMLLNHLEELFKRIISILDCSCKDGCPQCAFLPRCSNNNTRLDKKGAIFLANEIISGATSSLGEDYNNILQVLH